MTKRELWNRIANYHFTHLVPLHSWDAVKQAFFGIDASEKAFASKVSRKLGWPPEFARRAVWEYKKFVYLGVVSEFVVTPSKVVDAVWHEHLLFTQGYRDFCNHVIEADFNHFPELIEAAEQTDIFKAQYLATIELYRKEFGGEPPSEIWAVPKFDGDISSITLPKNSTPRRKSSAVGETYYFGDSGGISDSAPLVTSYSSESVFDFGGGESAGGGASDSWGESSSSDGGDSSDSGGSSCSSSCGGGCGGD